MHSMNSFRAALLLITATTSLAALTPAVSLAAIAGPTPKRCGAPLSGVTHLRAATSITCALAQRVVRTREQRGKPPLGWNCNDAKKISGSRYYSKSCKLGSAHGGAIIRYWVLHPTAFSGENLRLSSPAPPVAFASLTRCAGVGVNFYSHGRKDGEGGAGNIRVVGLSCRAARKILVRCIKNGGRPGWSAVRLDGRYGSKLALRSGRKSIRADFAGGGYCVAD